jgi:YggT family protein
MPNPIIWLLLQILNLYTWVIIIQAVLSILISFNVVNRYQPFVQQLGMILTRLTEPVYRRVRRYVPSINGVDLSPIVILLGIQFIQYCIYYWVSH